jgi:hypothetical protein
MIQHQILKLLSIEEKRNRLVRVENSNGCFSTAQLNLMYQQPRFWNIKDVFKLRWQLLIQGDTDGVSSFDFSITTPDIKAFTLIVNDIK